MSQRVIVGLEPGADVAGIKAALAAHGVDWSRDPSPAQPDVLVVSVTGDVDEAMRAAKALRGVRYVERDAPRSTF